MKRITERYRYSIILLKQLVKTDFKLRYQGSVLGYVWSLLRPLLMFGTIYVVFTYFLKIGNDIPHKPVYLLLGIVLWNCFGEITSGGVTAIVGKEGLIRKLSFPKYTIILAVALSALINLLLSFVIVGVFMVFDHVELTWNSLLIIPLVIELFVVATGVAFGLSALFVRFRDVSYIWEVLMQIGFYAAPIFYPLTMVPHKFAKYLILNPLAQIVQDARYVLVTTDTQTIYGVYGGDKWIWLIPVGLSLLVAVLCAWYFRARSKYFAEEM